jgi:hypothetical protein
VCAQRRNCSQDNLVGKYSVVGTKSVVGVDTHYGLGAPVMHEHVNRFLCALIMATVYELVTLY